MKPTLRNAHWIALLCLMLTAACAALESNNAPANNNAAPAADTANANTPPTLQPAPSLTAVPPATAPAPTATTPPVPATAQPISPTAAKPAAQPAAHVEGPKLVMVSQEHDLDFGKQPQDKALVRPIRIKNGGTQTLNIESVSPS
ncbi:MAG: hypothetical protein ACJ74G_10805 [Blastocatellia bacterium]